MEESALENALGTSFHDLNLLEVSLVHRSFLNENPGVFPESNERMEFLGDALLGLVIAEELYKRYPHKPEGELTVLRTALVRGDTLARIGKSMDLGQYLFMGRGEQHTGGRERQSNLACAFEAVIGAVLLDQGYERAKELIIKIMADEIRSVENTPQNPKSLLQELVQQKGMESPTYRVVQMKGEDHAREFISEVTVSGKVMGRGIGTRKTDSESEAAARALETLEFA